MKVDFTHVNNERRKILNAIIRSSFEAIDPYESVLNSIEIEGDWLLICGNKYNLQQLHRIFLTGLGKAVVPMAAGVVEKLGDRIHSGIIVSKHQIKEWDIPNNIKLLIGSHPIPSQQSITSAKELINFVEKTNASDLIINLISGGGSALVSQPITPITIEDLGIFTKLLLESGAKIQEINTIRKHIDEIKGGGLAKKAGSTPMESLIISDVLGDDISMIASGPTSADHTTFNNAWEIIEKYGIEGKIPESIVQTLTNGVKGKIDETLKIGDEILKSKHNHVICSLSEGIKSAQKTARSLGFKTQVISSCVVGEAREVGKVFGTILKSIVTTDLVLPRPCIIIAGGETTVTVTGKGKGGRNQEIAFGAMTTIQGVEDCAVIALATDGEDGPTDAAGAIVTGSTLSEAETLGLNPDLYGSKNDTYAFFDQLNCLIRTGSTGTNVNDLLFLLAF